MLVYYSYRLHPCHAVIKDVEICKSTLCLSLIDLCPVHHKVLMIYTGCLFIVPSHQGVIRGAALYLRNIITSICHISTCQPHVSPLIR